MAEVKKVNYDPAGGTLSVFFEDYKMCQGIADASEYEIFEDMELADEKGISKIVGIDILDMERFNPDNVPELTEEQRNLVAPIFKKYKTALM